jgi:hypothetical protein
MDGERLSKSSAGPQLEPVDGVSGWRLDADTMTEIDRILRETISAPIGPEFMAPPNLGARL